jgi:hypothetical protein
VLLVRCHLMGMHNVQVVVAADVIYDDAITKLFCSFLLSFLLEASRVPPPEPGCIRASDCLGIRRGHAPIPLEQERWVHAPGEAVVIVAAEKRYVFTMYEQKVCAPAFDHFLACLGMMSEGGYRLAATELDVDRVPVALTYERGRDLVLLQVTLQALPATAD